MANTKIKKEKKTCVYGVFDEYVSELCSYSPCRLNGLSIIVGGNFASYTLGCALLHLGAVVYESVSETGERTPELIRIGISPSGKRCGVSQGKDTLDFFHILALDLGEEIKNGAEEIALPSSYPDFLFSLADSCSIAVREYCINDCKNEIIKKLAARQAVFYDACASCVKFLGMVKHYSKSVGDFRTALPKFSISEGVADCAQEERASILAKLGDAAKEGVKLELDEGTVRVVARRNRGFSLMAEAAEISDACDLIREARNIIEKNKR